MSFPVEDYEGEVHRLAANNSSQELYEKARKLLLALELQVEVVGLQSHIKVLQMVKCGCEACNKHASDMLRRYAVDCINARYLLDTIEMLDSMNYAGIEAKPEEIQSYLEMRRQSKKDDSGPISEQD